MARINRISITLCALLFTTLPLTPMAHASKQARESSATTHITKKADKKKSTATTKKTQKASQKTAKKAASKSTIKSKTASSVKKSSQHYQERNFMEREIISIVLKKIMNGPMNHFPMKTS